MWQWERLHPNRYDAPMKPLPWDVEEKEMTRPMTSKECFVIDVDGSPVTIQTDPNTMKPEELEALKAKIRRLRRQIDEEDLANE